MTMRNLERRLAALERKQSERARGAPDGAEPWCPFNDITLDMAECGAAVLEAEGLQHDDMSFLAVRVFCAMQRKGREVYGID